MNKTILPLIVEVDPVGNVARIRRNMDTAVLKGFVACEHGAELEGPDRSC